MGSGRWVQGVILSSLLSAGVSRAYPGPGAPPPSDPSYRAVFAQDPAVTALYALVPSDAPALLPLEISTQGVYTTSEPDVPSLATVPLTVGDDPTGTVSAYTWLAGSSAELTWTPGVDREFGRSYTASLDVGAASTLVGRAQWYYTPSTFEFSYIEGTSATFLPQVEFTLSDIQEIYGAPPPACCEIDAALCAGASSCYQCWDQWAILRVHGVWSGPGLPYLLLTTEPAGAAQLEKFGESCIRGTAIGGFETRHLSACVTLTEWPEVEVEGRDTVFADSCNMMPEGYYPLTRLFVVRARTEAAALRRLSGESEGDPPSRCSLSSRPAEGSALSCLAVVLLLGALGRRRIPGR